MEWVSLLERFQRELTRCKSNQAHVYFSQLGSCPWCSIEAHGIVLFIDLRVDITPGLNVDILWKKLSSLPPLEALAPIPTNANWNASVFPTTDARLLGRTRKVRLGIGIATVVVSVCFVVALNINGPVALILIGLAVAFAYKFPQRFQQKRDATAKVVRDCQKRYQELQMRYASECSEEIFCKKTKELGALRAQYNQLPLLRQQMIQELEKRKFQLQLHDFLDRINISDATIRLIGPGRKAMLVSFGIDSAADVSYASVTQVPGIGPKYANNLLDWRRSMEARFQFDPNKAIAKNETDKIDSEIHSRRSELQTTLSRGIQDAAASHSRILAVRASYQEQLKAAYKVFMQEQANLSVS